MFFKRIFKTPPSKASNVDLLTPGEPAPDFELTDVNGHKVRLSNYRGKPVVLAFLRGFM